MGTLPPRPSVACFVPIRTNSKRVPGKNTKDLCGKSITRRLTETLRMLKPKYVDDIYVYCSDNGITNHLPPGVTWLQRSAKLDADDVRGELIYTAFARDVPADIYVLCHATSPFLSAASIAKCIDAVTWLDYQSACTVKRVQTYAWWLDSPVNFVRPGPRCRTQDVQPIFVETSGCYVFTAKLLHTYCSRTGEPNKLVEVSAIEAIDIDDPEDFEVAESFASSLDAQAAQ